MPGRTSLAGERRLDATIELDSAKASRSLSRRLRLWYHMEMDPGSISIARQAMLQGLARPAEMVDDCLRSIEVQDRRLQAWVVVDAEGARRQARELEAAIAQRRPLGPLAAVAIGVKDIIDVEGLPTRAGSPLTSDLPAAADAPVVARLRQAGAIILGKTVTTEFAYIDPPPTRNPWNIDCTPGGSSSGSAVAVATGMCVAALGTQTGGSIIRPASYCGVCGIKPTFGAVSRVGVVPFSEHLDHVGCLARSIADLRIVWQAIVETEISQAGAPKDAIPANARPRLGVVEDFFEQATAEVAKVAQQAIKLLQDRGAELLPVRLPADFADVWPMHRTIMAFEGTRYHRSTYGAPRTGYGPKLRELFDEGQRISESTYRAAVEQQRALRDRMATALADVDAWVMPATNTAAPPLASTGDARFNSPWSCAGVPAVTLPCGLAASNGTAIGLQLVGPAHRDAQVLDCAAWCERQIGFVGIAPHGARNEN